MNEIVAMPLWVWVVFVPAIIVVGIFIGQQRANARYKLAVSKLDEAYSRFKESFREPMKILNNIECLIEDKSKCWAKPLDMIKKMKYTGNPNVVKFKSKKDANTVLGYLKNACAESEDFTVSYREFLDYAGLPSKLDDMFFGWDRLDLEKAQIVSGNNCYHLWLPEAKELMQS